MRIGSGLCLKTSPVSQHCLRYCAVRLLSRKRTVEISSDQTADSFSNPKLFDNSSRLSQMCQPKNQITSNSPVESCRAESRHVELSLVAVLELNSFVKLPLLHILLEPQVLLALP